MSLSGFLTAVALQGLESLLLRPQRSIGDFEAQVVIKERHEDHIEITEHPVERGAVISDHAFIRPAEVTIECGWSNTPSAPGLLGGLLGSAGAVVSAVGATASAAISLSDQLQGRARVQEIYERFLTLHKSRELVDVYTGKRVYKNMLIRSVLVETDEKTENSLLVTVVCREVIQAMTQVIDVPANSSHADPASTGSPVNTGTKQLQPAPNYNPQAGP
jgi:hypothetical protein